MRTERALCRWESGAINSDQDIVRSPQEGRVMANELGFPRARHPRGHSNLRTRTEHRCPTQARASDDKDGEWLEPPSIAVIASDDGPGIPDIRQLCVTAFLLLEVGLGLLGCAIDDEFEITSQLAGKSDVKK